VEEFKDLATGRAYEVVEGRAITPATGF